MNLMTDSAMAALDVLLDASSEYLEIGVTGGGCAGLQVGITKGNMRTTSELSTPMTGTGGMVMYTDQMSAEYLTGAIVDYEDNGISKGFVVVPPPNSTGCGCGSSFILADMK